MVFQGNAWLHAEITREYNQTTRFHVRITRCLSSAKFGNREEKRVLADVNDCRENWARGIAVHVVIDTSTLIHYTLYARYGYYY